MTEDEIPFDGPPSPPPTRIGDRPLGDVLTDIGWVHPEYLTLANEVYNSIPWSVELEANQLGALKMQLENSIYLWVEENPPVCCCNTGPDLEGPDEDCFFHGRMRAENDRIQDPPFNDHKNPFQ